MNSIVINVFPKSELLDPQSKAVHSALLRNGLIELIEVRQGKQFTFSFIESITPDLIAKIDAVAGSLLSNPVIEDYSIEIKNES